MISLSYCYNYLSPTFSHLGLICRCYSLNYPRDYISFKIWLQGISIYLLNAQVQSHFWFYIFKDTVLQNCGVYHSIPISLWYWKNVLYLYPEFDFFFLVLTNDHLWICLLRFPFIKNKYGVVFIIIIKLFLNEIKLINYI